MAYGYDSSRINSIKRGFLAGMRSKLDWTPMNRYSDWTQCQRVFQVWLPTVLRYCERLKRKDTVRKHGPAWASALVLLVCLVTGCAHSGSPADGKAVIVLGVDGMDPNFVERHWSDLPNLRRLRDRGGLTRLATTTPPQSPVAWSTFITGTDPTEHGIFDFVHREPSTLQPISSMAQIVEPAHTFAIGPWLLPLSSARVRSFRKGRAFWEILSAAGIPVTVVRMPTNYPPVEGAGFALAGMGTPDLEGTFGTFTFYTDDPFEKGGEVSGGRIVPVTATNHRVILPVEGPANTLRSDRRHTQLDLVADVDEDAMAARFRIGERQFVLKQGEWSPWIHVRFPLLGDMALGDIAGASGMFRLYVQQLSPGIRIYRSPLNIDPEDPALPVTAPASYGRELARRTGSFYTQGIEEDTAALRQGVLDLPEYLAQSRIVSDEHTALLRDSLDHFRGGFLFFYFSEVDQNSHMLWGCHDDELLKTYQTIDRDIGMVLDRAGSATVIVMSDHGFAAFNRGVNLNTWLWREGFLTLKQPDGGVGTGSGGTFASIDWKRTKAYAMGLNAMYVNVAGREKNGVVAPGAERDAMVADLSRRLLRLRDPDTGHLAVADIAPVGKTSSRFAPDLIVGYAPGYRASWETALGGIPADVIRENTDAWLGDHCISAAAVPGVLFGTRTPRLPDPQLKDLTVTILKEFGMRPDAAMTGRPVY
jgi:predicted AlkP superfamily phosphohydrolase/phosphomutase